MIVVLYWLYFDEEWLFWWVVWYFEVQGVFLFILYYLFVEDGFGGEDDLVVQVLVEMGLVVLEWVVVFYVEVGLLLMGICICGWEVLCECVEWYFWVDFIVFCLVVLCVVDFVEYQCFYVVIFGIYFVLLVLVMCLEEFFVCFGWIVEWCMQVDGQVSEILVSVWCCWVWEGEV